MNIYQRWRWFRINFKYAFRIHKPYLILRLIWNYFKIIFLKKQLLRYVDFSIGWKCNMKCQHCFAVNFEDSTKRVMGSSDYRKVAEEAMKMGAINFSFQGGEPLLYKKLFDIIKSCYPQRNLISVTTNGILLTENMLKRLKKAGVDILTVSIDSGIPEEHDEFRNLKGAFYKALKGIILAKKMGLNVTVGCVVSRKNLYSEGIKKLIKLCENLKIILLLIYAVPIGRWKNNLEVLLREEDIYFIKKLTQKSGYIRTDFFANYLKYGCGAGKEILYLTPYGEVLACPFIHISFGNIFNESLSTIRNRILKVKYFKVWYPKCLAGEDKKFIQRFILPLNRWNKFPVDYKDVDIL